MPNLNYTRGRQAEYKMQKILESLHYIVFRTAGSHGLADLIAVKPRKEGLVDSFPEIRFIQVKSSNRLKKQNYKEKFIKHLRIEYWKIPIKDEKWQEKYSKKAKKLKKKSSRLSTVKEASR